MKRLFVFSLILLITASGGMLWWKGANQKFAFQPNECPFCHEKILQTQAFFENEWAIALFPHTPITEGHILIIPKRHVERYEMLLEEEITQIYQLMKKVHQTSQRVNESFSYLILQKNGVEVGQTVPHVHFHYVPRKINETSWFSFLVQFFINPFQAPVSQDKLIERKISFQKEFDQDWRSDNESLE